MLSTRSGFDVCDKSLLSNHPKRPALIVFVRGAHHRRCAREGLTCFMMPYVEVSCKLTGLKVVKTSSAALGVPGRPRR